MVMAMPMPRDEVYDYDVHEGDRRLTVMDQDNKYDDDNDDADDADDAYDDSYDDGAPI